MIGIHEMKSREDIAEAEAKLDLKSFVNNCIKAKISYETAKENLWEEWLRRKGLPSKP